MFDLDALASDLGFVLKAGGAKGSRGIASQRKICFWRAPYGLWKKPDISTVCFGEKQSFQLGKCISRTPNNYRYLSAQEHYGRADNIE